MNHKRRRGLYTTLLVCIVLAGVLPTLAAPPGGRGAALQATPEHAVYLPIAAKPAYCPGVVQVLQNTGFEQGLVYWALGGNPMTSTNAAVSGYYSVWLGGYNDAVDTIRQDAAVPSWAESGAVYLSWLMYSDELAYEPHDRMEVVIYDAGGNVVTETSIDSGMWRGAWYGLRLPIPNVASYRGQALSVRVYAFTDGSLVTSWYVDEVWLRFGCGMELAGAQGAEFTPVDGAQAPAKMGAEKVVGE
ncbi:MAG: hypothetical protein ACYC4R_11155 [Anaerolineae bacterium]